MSNIHEKITNALHFRHACKVFDNSKKISKEHLDLILESGRLAPSSFGLEQWKFIVVSDDETKKSLEAACFKQPQIVSSSEVIIIAGRKDVVVGSDYTEECLKRFGDNYEVMKKTIDPFLKRLDEASNKQWVHRQCYIAATQMMMSGALLGIDSCPMEGFLPDKVDQILGLGDNLFPAIIIPFGYRKEEPKRGKMRWDLSDIVQYK